ncbi:MAG: DMT family transporter [Desulfovibrio sp.]|jgi:drug/metabolite transporter (DMT)-like permease|nr:DMT family transporter [Desulfovibrio sp.]
MSDDMRPEPFPLRMIDGLIAARPQLFGVICAFLATAVWSGNFIAGRFFVDRVPPLTLVALRGILASALLFPFALPALRRDWQAIRRRFPYLCLISFLGLTLPNTFVYVAAIGSEAVNLSIIALTTPLFVLVLSRVFFGEPLSGTRILGVGLVLCGVLLLLSRGSLETLLHLRFQKGDLFMFGNTVPFAIYTLLVRKTPEGLSAMSIMLAMMVLGTVFALPGAVWERSGDAPFVFSAQAALALLYISLGSSLVAYGLWNLAVRHAGPARAAIIYYLLPLFCGIEGVLLLGEPIFVVHFASMLTIVAGLLIAVHTRKPGP